MDCRTKQLEAAPKRCIRNIEQSFASTRHQKNANGTARVSHSLAITVPCRRRDHSHGEEEMTAFIMALAFFGLQTQAPANIQVVPVQGNVYLLAGAGANITVQVGSEGVLLVDSGEERFAPAVISGLRSLQA